MDIVYATDDGYAKHVAVSMRSLIAHNQKLALNFHIMSDGIQEETQKKLQALSDENVTVTIYPLDSFAEKVAEQIPGLDTGKFRATTLARLYTASVLPITVTKCLYLDADTVVLQSLKPLYRTKLGDYAAAMSMEPTIYENVRSIVGLSEDEPYYNAGMCLMNLSLWREENLEKQFLDYYRESEGQLPFNDQDVMNHVLKGRVLTVSQRYNFFSNYYYFRFSTLCSLSPWYGFYMDPEEYKRAKHHPVIVHFAGDERPWIRGSRNHYARAYDKYLAETEFAGSDRIRGRELYMQGYHLMNVMTFVCPKLRKFVSDKYYEFCISK